MGASSGYAELGCAEVIHVLQMQSGRLEGMGRGRLLPVSGGQGTIRLILLDCVETSADSQLPVTNPFLTTSNYYTGNLHTQKQHQRQIFVS